MEIFFCGVFLNESQVPKKTDEDTDSICKTANRADDCSNIFPEPVGSCWQLFSRVSLTKLAETSH